MAESNLKQKTLSGFFWRLAERFGLQAVSFIVNIILARELGEDAMGTAAMLIAFTEILQVFIDSGMGNALIQKKNSDVIDFSSVFYFNIVVCVVLYTGLFFAAPHLQGKYEGLSAYIRVIGLTLIVSGLKNIQIAYISKTMQFKKFFYSTMPAVLVSGAVGVAMAYMGYGIWAFVAQRLVNTFLSTLIMWFTVKWKPQWVFSFKRLKGLFSYGWKLFCSALIDRLYTECRTIFIGKRYEKADLGQYDQGQKIPKIIASNLNASIDGVLFPAMSQEQDNREKVKSMTRRSIKTSSCVIWPMMMGLAAVAVPLLTLLLGDEKWNIPSVSFFLRIFCITYAFYPIHTANLNAIKALGRSDIFLKLEIAKKVVGLSILAVTFFINVKAIAIGMLLGNIASGIINAFPNKKLLGYSYLEQIRDILPSMAVSVFMAVVVYLMQFIQLPTMVLLLLQVIVGAVVYFGVSYLFKLEAFMYIFEMVKKFLFKFLKSRKGVN
ncbi:MAG: lipopolysaccharide biosynthesis protein [Clostridia bacterium]|nr:lipopolysaccharide biosynthesis protein [Clostridia bacterium]